MDDRIAQWAIQSVYGLHAKVGKVHVERRINSTRLVVVPADVNLGVLFVKCTQPGYQEGHLEPGTRHLPSLASQNQNMFRASLCDPIRAPESLLSDDVRGILVTKYVDGANLKSILAKPVRPPGFDLAQLMKLAGKALASWHEMTRSLAPTIEGPTRSINGCWVKSFLDFSVWNILVAQDQQLVYIVDFPGSSVPALRHRDLATFLHSMLVIKLHPLAAVNPRPWWSWQDGYSRFLASYSKEAEIQLTEADYNTLQEELRTLVHREIETYRRLDGDLRRSLEARWYRRLLFHPALQSGRFCSLLQGNQ